MKLKFTEPHFKNQDAFKGILMELQKEEIALLNGFYDDDEIFRGLEKMGKFEFCRKDEKYDVLELCFHLV